MQIVPIVITVVGFVAGVLYIYEFVIKQQRKKLEEAKLHQVIEEAMRKQIENHQGLTFPSIETPNSKEKKDLLIKAYSCLRDGQYAESVDSFVRCLATETDEKQRIAFLISIGNSYYSQGKFDEAINTYQEAYNLAQKIGDDSDRATILSNLGTVYKDKGELERAVENYQKGLDIYTAINDSLGTANNLNNLGLIFQGNGDRQKALNYYQRAFELFEKAGAKFQSAITEINIKKLESLGQESA